MGQVVKKKNYAIQKKFATDISYVNQKISIVKEITLAICFETWEAGNREGHG